MSDGTNGRGYTKAEPGNLAYVYHKFGDAPEKIKGSDNLNLDHAKLRGAMSKWASEVDEIVGPSEDPEFDYLGGLWLDWMADRVPRFGDIVEGSGASWDRYNRIPRTDITNLMWNFYTSNGSFREVVDRKYRQKKNEPEPQPADSGDVASNGSNDGSVDSDPNVGDTYDGAFTELHELGIVEDDDSVNKAKLRGAMVNWAKKVEEIPGESESPDRKQCVKRFNNFMLEKFQQEWMQFIQYGLEPDDLSKSMGILFDRNEDFRELVTDKWVQREQKEEEKEEKSKSKSRDKTPGGLDGWAEKEGTTDTTKKKEEKKKVETRGKSMRARMREWKRHRAPPADRWEVEDIRNTIIRENVWSALDKMPTDSVDCVVTSPPYWNLRDYDGENFTPMGGRVDCDHNFYKGRCRECDAWQGQLGHEPEPRMFVENIVAIMAKISRVLKPTGSVFLNIGDNYAGQDYSGQINCSRKSMMMIPHRVYLEMIENGWVLRQQITWAKQVMLQDGSVHGATNPASVKDRINYTHEPLWWFANSTDYYADIFSVRREPKTDANDMSDYSGKYTEEDYDDEMYNSPTARAAREGYEPSFYHDDGALPPDVWQIPTGKAGKEHPAVFSPELPIKPIRMACPKWVCDYCGKGYVRETEDGEHVQWVKDCNHSKAERRPGIVFEPFCGRGTTPKVAEDEGRDWITTEVSDKYADFAEDYISGTRKMELGDF